MGCGFGESKERVVCVLYAFTLREAPAPDDPRFFGDYGIQLYEARGGVKQSCCASRLVLLKSWKRGTKVRLV